jgi:hypothetical protein
LFMFGEVVCPCQDVVLPKTEELQNNLKRTPEQLFGSKTVLPEFFQFGAPHKRFSPSSSRSSSRSSSIFMSSSRSSSRVLPEFFQSSSRVLPGVLPEFFQEFFQSSSRVLPEFFQARVARLASCMVHTYAAHTHTVSWKSLLLGAWHIYISASVYIFIAKSIQQTRNYSFLKSSKYKCWGVVNFSKYKLVPHVFGIWGGACYM